MNTFKKSTGILENDGLCNLQLETEKCNVAKQEIEWLGFDFTSSGISPNETKVHGKTEVLRPTNLKELRSLLGQYTKLTNLSTPNFLRSTINSPSIQTMFEKRCDLELVAIT